MEDIRDDGIMEEFPVIDFDDESVDEPVVINDGLESLFEDDLGDDIEHSLDVIYEDDEQSGVSDDVDYYSDDVSLSDFLDIDGILSDAIDAGASDVHISSDDYISFTIFDDIHKMRNYGPPPNPHLLERVQQGIILSVSQADFIENLELDTAYVIRSGRHEGRRTRLSIGRSFGHVFMVFRLIADEIPTPVNLGIDDELLEWGKLPSGLIMINGPTGTGKSTTLASILRQIQLTRPQKIITLENPIEYIYDNKGKGYVTQRAIGEDARSFAEALKSGMRQHPDIIMVGEVRDKTETDALLYAAETGHLALSSMHTISSAATINRIKGLYEGEDQVRILSTLSDVSRGFANQVLLKSVDGKSRFAVREILPVNREVSKLILSGDINAIRNYQIDNNLTMEQRLMAAVRDGRCTMDEALDKSPYPDFLKSLG